MLSEKHLSELAVSGIDEQAAKNCGLYTENSANEVAKHLNWKREDDTLAPAIVFPYFENGDISKNPTIHRVKRDHPRTNKEGKAVKYEQPVGANISLYIPPIICQTTLANLNVPLFFTEGEKKAISATTHGFPCVSAPGVWTYHDPKKSNTDHKSYIPRASLAALAINGRDCVICFDADKKTNQSVLRAEIVLADMLTDLGGIVKLVSLPEGGVIMATGLDDYLKTQGKTNFSDLINSAIDYPIERHLDKLSNMKLSSMDCRKKFNEIIPYIAVSDDKEFLIQCTSKALKHGIKDIRKKVSTAFGFSKKGRAKSSRESIYSIQNHQFFCRKETAEGPRYIELTNFEAEIIGQEASDDGGECKNSYLIRGMLANGRELPTATVPCDQFPSLIWVTKNWPFGAIVNAGIGAKDHTRAAIQHLSKNVVDKTLYLHTGWRHLGDEYKYLTTTGGVGVNGLDKKIKVEPGGELNSYALPEPPTNPTSLHKAVHCTLDLQSVASLRVSTPILAAIFRAVLGEVMKLDFSIFIAGPTGTFKTELTALAQAHFGASFNGRNLPANWASTANANERKSFLTKDALIVIDDFAPSGTAADISRLHRDADRLFRAAGNSAGRSRLTSELDLRPPSWPRGLIMASGEDIPKGHSCQARLFVVEVSPNEVYKDKLSILQGYAAEGLFAQTMAAFVKWVAPKLDSIKQQLHDDLQSFRSNDQQCDIPRFSHRRTPDIVFSLHVGAKIFFEFAESVGAIDQSQRAQLEKDSLTALKEAAFQQEDGLASEEIHYRFLELLNAAFTTGQAHLISSDDSLPITDHALWGYRREDNSWRAGGSKIGWIAQQEGHIYLHPSSTFMIVQQVAAKQGTNIGVNQKTLWKRLAESSISITRDKESKNTLQKTVGGLRTRVIVIPTTVFKMGAKGDKGADAPSSTDNSNHNDPIDRDEHKDPIIPELEYDQGDI